MLRRGEGVGLDGQGVDFADGLHLAKAEACEAFISFDQNFAQSCQRPWRHQGAVAPSTCAAHKVPLDQVSTPL